MSLLNNLHSQNTVVLVVDVQERLIPVLNESERFTQECRRFLAGCQLLGLPIIVTEQYPKGLGKTIPDVATLLNDVPVFEKTRFSAWTEEVQAVAQAYQAENFIIIGCETHICVLQTTIDLRLLNANVYVPQECVASRTEANRQNGLQQMRENGVVVSNTESLLFQLLGDAKHPQFKTISKLIV